VGFEVLFLGTSSDRPFPRDAEASDPQSIAARASVGSKDRRTRSSIFVGDISGSSGCIVDFTPDFYGQTQRFPYTLRLARCGFLTHAHLDHILGLYKEKISIPVWATPNTWRAMPSRVSGLSLKVLGRKTLGVGESLRVGSFAVTAYPVLHSKVTPTVGYVFSFEETSFAYVPDCSGPLPSEILRCDVIAIDGSSMKGFVREGMFGHRGILETLKQLSIVERVKQIVVTHVGSVHIVHEELEQKLKTIDDRVTVAFDGMRILFYEK